MKPMVIIARMSIGNLLKIVLWLLLICLLTLLSTFSFCHSGIALSQLLVSSLSFCFSSRRKAREIL